MRVCVFFLLAAACSSGTPVIGTEAVTSLSAVAGAEQLGSPGYQLAESLAVRLLDASGAPVVGAVVTWAAEDRQSTVSPGTSTTDSDGIARTAWRLGRDDGLQHAGASVGDLAAVRFSAGSVTGGVVQASGTVANQCGQFSDDVVRCWSSPDHGPARSISLDTELRFASLGYAEGVWCGGTQKGEVACFDEVDLNPGGQFRPDAAPVRTIASGLPVFLEIVGAGDVELGTTWCGVTASAEVWCWGANYAGQVGDGSIGGVRDTPSRVMGDGDFKAFRVAVTNGAVCALDVTGAAWCWGSVDQAVVDGGADVASPVAVPTTIRFSQIAATGGGTICGRSGLLVHCWGTNDDGGLGRGGVSDSPVPTPIAGTDFYTWLGAATDGFLAVTADRDLLTWGGLSAIGISGPPTRVLPGYLFRDILPGGGDGVLCLNAYPVGTRCVDRLAITQDLSGTASRTLIHGIPGL